jgi:hypothetical protein
MGRSMWLTRAGVLAETLEKQEEKEKEEVQMVPESRRLSRPKAAICRAFTAVRRVRRNSGGARIAAASGFARDWAAGWRRPSREMRRMQMTYPAQRSGPSPNVRSGRAQRPIPGVRVSQTRATGCAPTQTGSAISVAVNAADPRCSAVCSGSIHARRSPRWMSGSAQKITRARAADTKPSAACSSWSTWW